MAKQKNGVNKSEEIRQLLKANPRMKAKEIVSKLAGKGISVAEGLVYFIKGKIKGRKGRRQQFRRMAATVAATTRNGDALSTILKVKGLASEVGGLSNLKALVDALGQ